MTSDATIPDEVTAVGRLVARADGRLAGLEVALAAFRQLDPRLVVEVHGRDGRDVEKGELLALVRGPARTMLGAERTALNFLGHLSGVATTTRGIAQAIAGTGARVVCTRKTTPGFRALEKYAVRCGGGANHRFGLDDAILIKDNHRAVAGGITPAIERARRYAGHLVKIEVEVSTLEQLDEAITAGADVVMLDNMSLALLRAAVERTAKRVVLEASGGITPETAPAVAQTGVDLLSVGWLTHSAPNLDVALDVE